jgi:hypothetical protein
MCSPSPLHHVPTDVEKAAEFVPAIKEETYVSMMPRICALEIALEAAQWKEGTHFIWSTGRAEGFERWNQKVLRVADTGPLAALKPEQLREAMSAQWK